MTRNFAKWIGVTMGLLMATAGHARAEEIDAATQNKRLGRAVNVLGYDPIWRSMDRARFKAKHFKTIKDGGFNSIRVNLHPFRQMGPPPDCKLGDSWTQTLDWIITNALSDDLLVILDLHEFNAMGANPEANKEKFLAFWKQIAPKFKDAPSNVIFEILNEPSGKLTPQLWNQYLADALAIIRSTNPARTVIVGPAFWNGIDHLRELKLPEQDRNLIVTVHYYAPMDFTHQGASWAGRADKIGVTWDGTDQQRAAIARDFKRAADWATANNRPIFLGEFGAYDKAEMASRARYTAAVARTAEQLGWSWAYWQFDSDFVVYDIARDQWVDPIHKALIAQ